MVRFFLDGGAIRGAILNGSTLVNKMRSAHGLGILETLVLGRAYLGCVLMASDLKGRDRISLKIECSGPVKGLVVEANAFGEVRGYLMRVPIPLEKPIENTDLSAFFGAGFLTVTRDLQSAKQPFEGRVMLRHGNIAMDLANYYLESEQIPTAFNLSIDFDREGNVRGAGGLFLQAMPGASAALIEGVEERVTHLPSAGPAFAEGQDPWRFVMGNFGAYKPQFLAEKTASFHCHCTRERLEALLLFMPPAELQDMLEKGPFPMEMQCRYCNRTYAFEQEDLERLVKMGEGRH